MQLHAVTAENGGDDVVKEKLKKEGVELSFPVHSDPDCKLLATGHRGGEDAATATAAAAAAAATGDESGKKTKGDPEIYVENEVQGARGSWPTRSLSFAVPSKGGSGSSVRNILRPSRVRTTSGYS